MLKTLPTEVPEMKTLDFVTLMQIQEMASVGMNKEEILNTFSIDKKDFDTDEEVYFNEFYAYGKGMGVYKVGNNLLESTRGKNGQPAAMAYLRRFAKEFEAEIEGDSGGEFSFEFHSNPPDLKVVK